ncbi:hypothetical protein FSP39_021599 [Pinctada imbricata]|uniref:SWIM-type domain-containing protein n=1 Tax=Pinctada imbricata TaxID=66713 RepID=A0AA88Y168_PINIB|nr:hypothetical protein FSP39_021599 [Pinctada imbricata]
MPGQKACYFQCVLCSKRTKPKERRKVTPSVKKFLRKSFLLECTANDVICNKYRLKFCRDSNESSRAVTAKEKNRKTDSDDEFEPPQPKQQKLSSPPSVSLSIKSTVKSHGYCIICRKPGPKLIVISPDIRTKVLINNNVLIPAGSHCCPSHITEDCLSDESIESIQTMHEQSYLNRSTILDIVTRLREICIRQNKVRLDFDSPGTLQDDDYKELTGLSKHAFDDLFSCIEAYFRNTPTRSQRCSLAIFLCKMRNGLSNKFLATLFNISKSSVRRAISTVRKAMMRGFVPQNLGFNHISREKVISDHTRQIAQSLLGDVGIPKAILVLDGTYIYIEKSNNFHFQRRSYSLHKGRPLVKPMVITTTTGYYVSILGPYFADSKNNDASILTHILKSNVEDIRNWVEKDDTFVVDRGFRDSLTLLEDLGIKAEMPRFLGRGDKQMTTEDAKMSRLVTKVRWVVESANARIKMWKYLAKTLPTNQVPNIGDYVRIVCALSNKYFPPLNPTLDHEADESEAAKMLHLSRKVNELKNYVEENGLVRKTAKWKRVNDDDIDDFPTIDEERLRNITCGTYQLKLSTSYIQEHVDNESDIFIHKDDPTLLRIKIQSRHTSSRKYTVWIRYSDTDVESWYCLCRAGARVVGVCSHVAALLWYFGGASSSGRSSFGVRDWGATITDAVDIIPEIIDGSDSEDDIEE